MEIMAFGKIIGNDLANEHLKKNEGSIVVLRHAFNILQIPACILPDR